MAGIPHCIECTKFTTDAEAAFHLRKLSEKSIITENIVASQLVANILDQNNPNYGTRICGGYTQSGKSVECYVLSLFTPRSTS